MIEANFAQVLRDQLELDLRKAISDEMTDFNNKSRTQFWEAQRALTRAVRFEFNYKENMERAIKILEQGGFTVIELENRSKRYIIEATY